MKLLQSSWFEWGCLAEKLGFGITKSKVKHGWRFTCVLECGAGAEPLLQALDAPGMKPGAGQCFHSWSNYLHTDGRMLHRGLGWMTQGCSAWAGVQLSKGGTEKLP